MDEICKYKELEGREGQLWNQKNCPDIYDEGFVKLGDVNGVFPRSYTSFYQRIKSFTVKPDDIWLVSFPKCGTTWSQEMVWCIMNNLDFAAAAEDLQKRFPYFELRANWSPKLANAIQNSVLNSVEHETNETSSENPIDCQTNFFLDSFSVVENLTSPRFIKSHLHYSLLPSQIKSVKPKLIYVARNPKAACVSYYHHCCLIDGFTGSLADFVDCFTSDNVTAGPYWSHVREFWKLKEESNVLFLTYEEMKKDLREVIRKTSSFLNKSMDESQIELLTKHLSFASMKENASVNYEGIVENMRKIHGRVYNSSFMRKGQVDSWKEDLTPNMIEKIDTWITANRIQGLY